jgi:hypothetical protein
MAMSTASCADIRSDSSAGLDRIEKRGTEKPMKIHIKKDNLCRTPSPIRPFISDKEGSDHAL